MNFNEFDLPKNRMNGMNGVPLRIFRFFLMKVKIKSYVVYVECDEMYLRILCFEETGGKYGVIFKWAC